MLIVPSASVAETEKKIVLLDGIIRGSIKVDVLAENCWININCKE